MRLIILSFCILFTVQLYLVNAFPADDSSSIPENQENPIADNVGDNPLVEDLNGIGNKLL